MPIFLGGNEYNDEAHLEAAFSPMLKNLGVDVQPVPPAEQKGDEKSVKAPNDVYMNQQLEKQDDEVFGGTEVSYKQPRLYVSPARPLQASTEPAGEFNSSDGTGVALNPNPTPEPSNAIVEPNVEQDFLQRLTGTRTPRPVLDILMDFAKEKGGKILDALKLPGDAWAGDVDPMSEQGIERANILAGLMVGGPAPVAAKMADGSLGSFAGVRAKTISPERMTQFHILEGNAVHPDDIWTKTGMMRGADRRLRFEIDDSKSKFDTDWISKAKPIEKPSDPTVQHSFDPYEGTVSTTLSKALDHPELYEAYPWLKDVRLVYDPAMSGAHWSGLNNTIAIGTNYSKNKGILMHEVQHAIQDYERFAPGSALSKTDSPEAYNFYRRSAGEVESNNVDTRLEMNAPHRRKVPPTWTEDVPRNQQIITEGYGMATPEGMFDQRTGMAVATKVDPVHLSSPEAARFRLGQLLRDKAASKKAGDDVEGTNYMFYNAQIRQLREYLKNMSK